jgi:hypothetical protein
MARRYLLAGLGLVALAGVLLLRADEPGATPAKTADNSNKIKQDLPVQEDILSRRFQKFQDSLQTLMERLERSSKLEDRERAAVLRKALDQAKDASITTRFEQLVNFLKNSRLDNTGDLGKAEQDSMRLADDLRMILALLREDSRAAKLREERKRLEELVKEINRLIKEEKRTQGLTQNNRTEPTELKGIQAQVRKDTSKVAQQLGKGQKGSQGGEAKDSKAEAKSAGKGEGKKGQEKDAGSGAAKAGESKEGGQKDGEAKSGQAKGNQDKQGQEGKAGQAKEGGQKTGAAKTGEAKTGAPKAGQAGAKTGQPKTGQAGAAKGGEKKNGSQAGASKSGGEKKAGQQGQQGQAKSGSQGGAGKQASAKSSQAGKSGQGQSKSGGQPGQQGQAKSGKSGQQGQAKSGGQKSQSGQQSQQGQAKDGGQQGQQAQQPPQPSPPQQDTTSKAQKRVQEAVQNMHKAEEKIAQRKNPDATDEEGKAIDNLEKAKKRLEDLLRQLREEELERLLANLQARCEKMLAMQIRVYDGTRGVQKSIDSRADKKASHSDKQESLKLSDEEKAIVMEASKAIEMLEAEGSAVAFPEVFTQVREDMRNVQRRLEVVDPGKITQATEEDIIATLRDMIEALKKAQQQLSQSKGSSGSPPPNQDQKLLDQIAELKMIRAMQIRVNGRTRLYGQQYQGEQAADPNLQREIRGLSERQERIFEVTNRIVRGDNR